MYNEKNLVYILTILENIEKIKIYSSEFGKGDRLYGTGKPVP